MEGHRAASPTAASLAGYADPKTIAPVATCHPPRITCSSLASASYAALLDDADGLLTPGLRGRAKILVREQTWGAWLWRTARQTFHFKL